MRVLFVVRELKMEPLGVMYLSAALKQAGHEARLARCDFGESPEEVVVEFKPDFLCYSVCSGSEDFYLTLARKLSSLYDEARSVFGGPAVTFSPRRWSFFGDAVRGEGERAIVSIVGGKKPRSLQLVDVNAIPDADRELVYQFEDLRANPIKNVISRRGCKYACSYCFNREWNRLHRDQLPTGVIRYRHVGSVVEECRKIKRDWPVKMINFVDDNFISSPEWLEEFALTYPREVGLPFFCSVRPDDVTEHLMSLLARAGGAVINFAIESANDENRRRVLTRTGTRKAVIKTVELVRRFGMRSRLQSIVGLPVPDPLADAYETLKFNIKCRPTSSWCAILQAYQGTKVREIAEAGGYATKYTPVDDQFFGVSTLRMRDRRKIERLHKLWPMLTRFPFLVKLAAIMVRIPLPFSWFSWIFRGAKRYLCERELWRVFNEKR